MTHLPDSPSNPLPAPNLHPLSPSVGSKRRSEDAANSKEKRSRSGDEGDESEAETTASTVASTKRADPKKVRILCDNDPDGCMPEALFDRFHIKVNDLVLQDLKSGKLDPEQSTCLGHFSYDARTSRGVVMLLDEADLEHVKHYTNLVEIEDEDTKAKVSFSAIGGAEILQKYVYARVDRLPVVFTLQDPDPIFQYIKDRLPFLKAEPVKLELEDFSFPSNALARKETKVLLKLVAKDRLMQYLRANDWKIPFAGTLLPFEQPRKTGYESSLRQARRAKSPGPQGPRDRSRSTHSQQPRQGASHGHPQQPRLEPSPGSLARQPHPGVHLTAEQLAEQRRQMEVQHAQWVKDNPHLFSNANRVVGTPYRPPSGPSGHLADQLTRQRSLAPRKGGEALGSAPNPGHGQGQGQVRGPPQRVKVRMDVEYPPGSDEAAIQRNRRNKKAAKAKEAADRAEQARMRLDNKFGALSEPDPTQE